ncbi:MAG TPA: MdtA/MuxA family multidrug efflux RND transporter periplasmic adaptor subunit [Bryobacteraceae bacterium]|nr:MdtA/MuxA family multidrug efflux RND transporter periplasmic adaptor subunit [Bryobacteraceae bacterium]
MEHATPTALEARPPELTPPQQNRTPRTPPEPPRRRWIGWLVVLALAGVGYWQWPRLKPLVPGGSSAQSQGETSKGGRGRRGGGGVAQVVTAKASKGNIKVYVTGLGAVTPVYTVTVNSRVTGELMAVHFKEGQIVQKGDLLVEIDPRPYQVQLDQAEGQLIHDEALLKNARLDLQRYQTLIKQDAVPQQTLDAQSALVSQYEGTIKTDQSQIDNAKLNLVYCHITSPIAGRVGLRLVDPGNIVQATSASGLVVITQLDPISVIFTTAEDQLPPILDRMHGGQELPVEAWDRELKNRLAEGKLETIDNQIDPTTGTLKLRAVFANAAGKLFPSQFVNARLLVQQKQNVTLLPNNAIQRNAQGAYVWLVSQGQTVNVRPITVGTVEGDQSEIVAGLEPGDEVVTIGVDRLEEGGKVNTQVPGAGRSRGGRSSDGKSPDGKSRDGKSHDDKSGGGRRGRQAS